MIFDIKVKILFIVTSFLDFSNKKISFLCSFIENLWLGLESS